MNLAWSRQKDLKRDEIPSIEAILNIVNGIENPRDRALFVLAYLTAGRISEITDYKQYVYIRLNPNEKPAKYRKEFVRRYAGITKKNMVKTESSGREILLIDLPNRKNDGRPRKKLPVTLDKDYNIELVNILLNYIKTKEEDEALFPITPTRAWQIISKYGYNPHFLRDIKLTHLVIYNNFNDQELIKYAGWSDGRPAKNYIQLRYDDMVKKL